MSTEDREATLLLEVACARWDVCHAQKQLTECLNRETKSLCALHQLKVKKFAELMDDANLNIGRIRATFNSYGRSPQVLDVNTTLSHSGQDEDGGEF